MVLRARFSLVEIGLGGYSFDVSWIEEWESRVGRMQRLRELRERRDQQSPFGEANRHDGSLVYEWWCSHVTVHIRYVTQGLKL